MVSAVAPPNVAGTLATVISQTSCANKLPLRPGVLAQTRPPPASLMHVEIGGLRNKKGQVVCDGYSSGDGFPKNGDKALVHAKSPISKRTAACDFPDVKAGPYAVSVVHGENSDGKLDINFTGFPVKAWAPPTMQKAISVH
jgi:uncharacterized protein (DUF2141 family)